jgi:hypothetical protein
VKTASYSFIVRLSVIPHILCGQHASVRGATTDTSAHAVLIQMVGTSYRDYDVGLGVASSSSSINRVLPLKVRTFGMG